MGRIYTPTPFTKGSHPERKVQFFLTLFKRPLTPPPLRLNIMQNLQWVQGVKIWYNVPILPSNFTINASKVPFRANFNLPKGLQNIQIYNIIFWTWVWRRSPLFELCMLKKMWFWWGKTSLNDNFKWFSVVIDSSKYFAALWFAKSIWFAKTLWFAKTIWFGKIIWFDKNHMIC